MRMVTLILLSDASSLELEDPSRMVLMMSGRRLLIFRAGSAVFSAVSDGLTCLAGERPVVDDEQARVAETLKKLHRGDMDIVAYEDEHKFDGDGDEPA